MKLNRTDYVLERASDGGYYAWLTVNMQCNAYGESPEEAVQNLLNVLNAKFVDDMRGSCVFIDDKQGIADVNTSGSLR